MAQYVRISSEDMDSFMGALGFRELSRESRGLTVKEKVFERPFHEGRIRVYSSVEDRPGRLAAGRKMGRDAIRVQYWIDDTKVFGAKRVHRVVNWRRNMLDRVYDIEDMFGHRPVPRDSSGNPMVARTSKQGKKFWGSRDFPRNKDTRRFNAESFEADRKLLKELGERFHRRFCSIIRCGPKCSLRFGEPTPPAGRPGEYVYVNTRFNQPKLKPIRTTEYDEVYYNFSPETKKKLKDWAEEQSKELGRTVKLSWDYCEGHRRWGKHIQISLPKEREKNAESLGAVRKLRKESCCCGADIENPCECMYEGVMNCRADEPKCPCYEAKTEVKEAVVFAPRKPTGILDKVMLNHAMIQEVQLQQMIEYMENMVQLGLLDEDEVMKELRKTFGSEYFFDNSVEDIVMDEYLEDEDYDDAEIYARNAMKELKTEDELTTPDGYNQEEYFRDKFDESERLAQEASHDPLGHLGFWFEMADESYGGHIRDMLEKPWNWRQEMTRYLFEGGYEGVMYGDDEDLFALGFDASYPPYLTLKELGELYDWMPTYEDYKGYVHNFYRAEYQEVNKSPLGVIVKGKDGKTYVLVPQDLAEIIFQQSKYVLDAEWRKEELLYSDELNDMMPISVGTMMFDKIYVATRNEGEDIVTYIVQEEIIDGEKLYRILVVIDGPLGTTHKKYLEVVMGAV